MQNTRAAKRFVLIALTLLSACGASGPTPSGGASVSGAPGEYLVGRFALAEGDYAIAAANLLKAAEQDPGDPEVTLQAFIASVDAGRPEAVKLAKQLPGNPVAQLVLADADAKAGHWQAAEQRFRALPRQGMTQLLQPLLVAWAQQGMGQTDAALGTLRPYINNDRFRDLFVLHAAMIADVANRPGEAGRLYRIIATDMAETNLRLAQTMASWQARSGHAVEAQRTLAALPLIASDMSIAMPGLLSSVTKRPVAKPTDGIAEAYFTLAALLRGQEANDFALVMLHLALDMRPDFAASRILASDTLDSQNHPRMALAILNDVSPTDPILPVVQLRRVILNEKMGRTEEALRDLERMSRDYPNSPLPDFQRCDILRRKNRYADAIAACDRAIARIAAPSAGDWPIFYARGVAHERSHQWDKAEADFRAALKLSPDQPFVLNYLGYSFAEMGRNLPEARKMIEIAAERRPDDGAITDSLGWIQFRSGETDAAVKTLQRAVELDPEDPTINEHLGDAYWAAGRKIEARYQWQRALTLKPAPEDLVKLKAKLADGGPGAVARGL